MSGQNQFCWGGGAHAYYMCIIIDNRGGGGIGNARIRNMYSPRHGHAHFMSACSLI